MFNMGNAKKMCKVDQIPLIEGYSEALHSPEKYVIHHRNEIQPDGVVCSKNWLIQHDLYWKRDAHELIFMKETDHRKLHSSLYWTDVAYKDTRDNAIGKMKESKVLTKGERSVRMKQLWCDNRDVLKTAIRVSIRKRPKSVYCITYGMNRKEIAEKLGLTEWRVQELHKRGELLCHFQ